MFSWIHRRWNLKFSQFVLIWIPKFLHFLHFCEKYYFMILDSNNCININECQSSNTNDCPTKSSCVDTDGSYYCECNSGYERKWKLLEKWGNTLTLLKITINLAALSYSTDMNLTMEMGQIVSPNYPNNYPNSLICSWIITVPVGYQVYLKIHSFEVCSKNQSNF